MATHSNIFREDTDLKNGKHKENVYPINGVNRCLIINNYIANNTLRSGAEKEHERFEGIFNKLKFEVEALTNQTSKQIKDAIIKHCGEGDNSSISAFVLIIMSHGNEGYICGTDQSIVRYVDIVSWLNNQECSKLVGKPKLCFFHACNGGAIPVLLSEEGPEQVKNRYPVTSDILLSFAAQEGYVTGRLPQKGSIYINCLANALVDYARCCDVLEILQIVEKEIRAYQATFADKKEKEEITVDACLSTEVKLLGWERKFYFWPQEQGNRFLNFFRGNNSEQMEVDASNEPGQNAEHRQTVMSGLYVLGGSQPPECLCEDGDSWRTIDGTGLEDFVYCQAIAYREGSVYFGSEEGIHVWKAMDHSTTMLCEFESDRRLFSHAFMNDKIYVMGGETDAESSNHCWAYDTLTQNWEGVNDLKCPCSGRTAVVHRDRIYITPGEKDEPMGNLDQCIPGKDWTTKSSKGMVPKCWHATATCGRYLWVFGGRKGSGRLNVCKDVERYHFGTGSWEKRSPMLTARSHLSVAYFKNEFYAIGGRDVSEKDLNVVEIYNIEKDEWRQGAPLNHARYLHNYIVIQ